MVDKAKPVFVVTPRVQDAANEMKPRLIRAARRSRVATHILQDFNITPASADDIHEAAKAGVEIETASESDSE